MWRLYVVFDIRKLLAAAVGEIGCFRIKLTFIVDQVTFPLGPTSRVYRTWLSLGTITCKYPRGVVVIRCVTSHPRWPICHFRMKSYYNAPDLCPSVRLTLFNSETVADMEKF